MNVDLLVAFPIVIGCAVYMMDGKGARPFAAGAAFLQFLFGLSLINSGQEDRLTSFHSWLPSMGIHWSLGLDGANTLLVMLTPLLTVLAILAMRKVERTANFVGNIMLLSGCLCGLFLAQNLGLFYIFFEAMLLPTLMLVAGWSRRQGKKTAVTFLMFTLAGSLPMLLSVLVLAFQHEPGMAPSLEFTDLGNVPHDRQFYLFFPFLLAFLIKMPMVPFHGWLPPLYRNAPAPVVVLVAAVMSKAGTYGLFKVGHSIFGHALALVAPYLLILGVLSLLYGALSALGANSVREVLAFSSLSHIAMIALGIFSLKAVGNAGAGLQMAAHAVATGGLFLVVALMERRNLPDEMRRYGGLSKHTPRLAVLSLFLVLASLGQPGMGSFPAELMILTGLWQENVTVTILAGLGIVLAAAYLLRWYQTLFTGEEGTYRAPKDLTATESLILVIPIAITLAMGLVPSSFLESLQVWVAMVTTS